MSQRDRIKRARALITLGEAGDADVIQTYFESLGNELGILSRLFTESAKRGKIMPRAGQIQELASSFRYTSLRLTDLFTRLALLNLMRNEIGRISQYKILHSMWYPFAALAIKDFHTDVSSLMDSTLPWCCKLKVHTKTRTQTIRLGSPATSGRTKGSGIENISRPTFSKLLTKQIVGGHQ
jgi:hypothetical protein